MKKECQVCQKIFDAQELYPLSLLRTNVFENAKKKYPNLDREGFSCYPDLRPIHAAHYEEVLKEERGALSELEKEVLESIQKHEILSENINEEFDKGLSFGERLADKIAKFGGSWRFIIIFITILLIWMAINTYQVINDVFDPYPFILLNLVLSCLAAIQAPVIMMSQNRQSEKDRIVQEGDYQTNLKAELQVRQLNSRLDLFMKHNWQKMHEIKRTQEEILQEIREKP